MKIKNPSETFQKAHQLFGDKVTREIKFTSKMEEKIKEVFTNYKEIEKRLKSIPELKENYRTQYQSVFTSYLNYFQDRADAMKELSQKPEVEDIIPPHYDQLIKTTNRVVSTLEEVLKYLNKK